MRDVQIPGTRQIVALGVSGSTAIALGNVEGWRNPINLPEGVLVGPTNVSVLDISDPSNPTIVTTVATSVRPDLRGGGAAVVGQGQFVFGGTREVNQPVFLLVNGRDPANPRISTAQSPATVNNVTTMGGLVYAALEGSGLAIYEVQ
jgi:hypothetical protein